MIIECGPRQSGKSTRIASYMWKNPNSICIVADENRKRLFSNTFHIEPDRIFTPYNLQKQPMNFLKTNDKTKIYVDEVSAVMERLFMGIKGNVVMGTESCAHKSNIAFMKEYEAEFILEDE